MQAEAALQCFIISLFNFQHVSNVSTSIFRTLRLIVDLFRVLYSSGSMCVGVTVWFGWGGVVSLCRLKHFSDIKLVYLYSTIKIMHGPINLRYFPTVHNFSTHLLLFLATLVLLLKTCGQRYLMFSSTIINFVYVPAIRRMFVTRENEIRF